MPKLVERADLKIVRCLGGFVVGRCIQQDGDETAQPNEQDVPTSRVLQQLWQEGADAELGCSF